MMSRTESSENLANKRALVTGGGSGIGEACARALANAGAEVIVSDLDQRSCEAVAGEIGGEAWVVDLSDTASLHELTLDVDILVNNAGVQQVRPVEAFEPERFALMLRLMVEAPFLLIRAALPSMYERGHGRIINMSSVHGRRGSPYKSAYVTAKHALEGLSKVVGLEGGPHGVTSNCIAPGYVRTPLVESQVRDQARVHGIAEEEVLAQIMLAPSAVKRLVEPDEVASLVCWLAGANGGMVNGASLTMDGGWTSR